MRYFDLYEDLPAGLEKRAEFIKQQMGQKLEPIVGDVDAFIEKLADTDPSPKGNLMPWMARLVAKDPTANKVEDLPRLKKDLEKFMKHRNQIENKDVNAYKTFQSIYDAIKPFGNKKTKKELASAKLEKLRDQLDTVYAGNEGWIRIPLTKAASCYLGQGTRWCTSARNNNMFDYYNKTDRLFVIFDRASGNRTQMHLPSNSHMDTADEPVGFDSIPDWAKPKIIDWYKSQGRDLGLSHAMKLKKLGANPAELTTDHDELFDLMSKYGV